MTSTTMTKGSFSIYPATWKQKKKHIWLSQKNLGLTKLQVIINFKMVIIVPKNGKNLWHFPSFDGPKNWGLPWNERQPFFAKLSPAPFRARAQALDSWINHPAMGYPGTPKKKWKPPNWVCGMYHVNPYYSLYRCSLNIFEPSWNMPVPSEHSLHKYVA